MRHRRGRLWTVAALLLSVFAAFGSTAARAATVGNLSPVVHLESEGIAARHFDIHLCDVCDRTERIYQLRNITVFADRSVVFVLTRNNLDDAQGSATTVATGVGSQAAFDELLRALAAAPLPAQDGSCFVAITRSLPPPPPWNIVTESSRDPYLLRVFGAGNHIERLAIDPTGPRVCTTKLRRAVIAVLDYAKAATGVAAY